MSPRGRWLGKRAGQNGEQVALLRQLFDQRRQRGVGLRELRLLGGQVEPAGIALGELVAQDLHEHGVDRRSAARVASICASQRGLLDRGRRDVGGQGGYVAIIWKRTACLLRLRRLDGAAVQSEDIGHVGDADLRGEQAVLEAFELGVGASDLGLLLARWPKRCPSRWDSRRRAAPGRPRGPLDRAACAALRSGLLASACSISASSGLGMEQGPPVAGDVGAGDEALGVAAGDVRGRDRWRTAAGRCSRRRRAAPVA